MLTRSCLRVLGTAFCTLVLGMGFATGQEEDYPLTDDSKPQEGVPQGEIKGPFSMESQVFPGTVRDYWVYVPSQYDGANPACLIVVQDGLNRANGWKLTTVMDNLIARGEMPVTIGIFVNPGVVPAPNENAQPRFNRSFEYDSMSGQYAQFLVDELIPLVEDDYSLSDDPNDRAVAGASSGGICAFAVAWYRPDQFRRVLSTIGTYVGLRGGNEFPTLVRKTEPKPIRVFLQDGENDLNLYAGEWWVANQDMLSALKFSGYDVKHAWGTGGHNGKHAAAIMPDALRWLWRDYPEPVANLEGAERRISLPVEGEAWELLSDGHTRTEGPATNAAGEVFFSDPDENLIHKIDLEGSVSAFAKETNQVAGMMFGPDGYLYAAQSQSGRIVRYDDQGREELILDEAPCVDVATLPEGGYFTDPLYQRVWHVDHDGNPAIVDEGIMYPGGIIPSADQTQLFVADAMGRFIYVFQIQDDGSLAHKQRYGYLHVAAEDNDAGAGGMTVDREGRLYVATKTGIQVLDQLGRVHFIFNTPGEGPVSNVVFGGSEMNYLYATSGGQVFRRKINAVGVLPWSDPVKPPRPRL